MFEWVKSNKNKEINGFMNHFWNGITCLQFAKIVEQIIKDNLFWKGVRHIFSPKAVSKYELLKMINDIYDFNIKINKTNTDELCDKSLSTIYNENNLFKIIDLKEQINEMKIFKLYSH